MYYRTSGQIQHSQFNSIFTYLKICSIDCHFILIDGYICIDTYLPTNSFMQTPILRMMKSFNLFNLWNEAPGGFLSRWNIHDYLQKYRRNVMVEHTFKYSVFPHQISREMGSILKYIPGYFSSQFTFKSHPHSRYFQSIQPYIFFTFFKANYWELNPLLKKGILPWLIYLLARRTLNLKYPTPRKLYKQKLYLPHYKFSVNLFKIPFNGKLFVNYRINKALSLTVYRNRKVRYKLNKLILIVRQNRLII